jgi:membrane-associated protein
LLGENAGLPLPGETILIFASFLAYKGQNLHLPWIIVVGIAAATTGDNIGYVIGHFGGRRLLEKWKHVFHISTEDIKAGEDFLHRRGSVAIFFARFIAGMRVIAGPLAGVLRMPWKRFVLANAAGAAVWVSVISLVGYAFGSKFDSLIGFFKKADLAVMAGVVALAWYLWRRRKKRVKQRQQHADGQA